MFTRMMTALILLGAVSGVHAGVVTLEDTIPSGPLFLQPPVITGAVLWISPICSLQSPICGYGLVVADAFTPAVSANLYQISVAVAPEDFGGTDMLLTLLTDSGDSPGTQIESWTVPLSTFDTSLTIITVTSVTDALLTAGQQYWLSVVPTDLTYNTDIGWGLASPGYPGIELPVAESYWGANYEWNPTALNIANEFSVTGTTSAVPEPATFWIAALALCALSAARHKWSGHDPMTLQ
jgi:hypothetical protein